MIHKHHIIPKHIGGGDENSNLIELTIEEHAEAHKNLYEDFGRWQDKLAWKALSGMIGREEIISTLQSEGGKSSQPILKMLKKCSFYNVTLRETAAEMGRIKCKENGLGFYNSELQSKLGKRGGPKNKGFVWINDGNFSIKYTTKNQSETPIEEFILRNPQYRIGRIQPSKIVECPHCKKVGIKSAMVLHHFDKCIKITGKKRTFKIKKIKCPYCEKEGAGGSMKRWHFNNCKLKELYENSKN